MKLIEHIFAADSRKFEMKLYAIGDVHIGALNCAEDKLRHFVRKIAAQPNAYWIGGGDYCDNVILGDQKRFDPTILPSWMLSGGADKVRLGLKDMVHAQAKRFMDIMEPIRDRCLGMIEGNHEYSIMKYHNRDLMKDLCRYFDCEDLTDCAFIRLKYRRGAQSSIVKVFISHGHGGGRTSGAEPLKLYRLCADKDIDILLTGHSHTHFIHPPIPSLGIPSGGALPDNPIVSDKHAANWGAFVYTYATGPSTYASRAEYPVRPMYTVETTIRPFAQLGSNGPVVMEGAAISMAEVRL